MAPFAYLIGKCTWVPPSAKAAAAFIAYFYGLDPGVLPAQYEAAIIQQEVAAGMSEAKATETMAWLDKCMLEAYP